MLWYVIKSSIRSSIKWTINCRTLIYDWIMMIVENWFNYIDQVSNHHSLVWIRHTHLLDKRIQARGINENLYANRRILQYMEKNLEVYSRSSCEYRRTCHVIAKSNIGIEEFHKIKTWKDKLPLYGIHLHCLTHAHNASCVQNPCKTMLPDPSIFIPCLSCPSNGKVK